MCVSSYETDDDSRFQLLATRYKATTLACCLCTHARAPVTMQYYLVLGKGSYALYLGR